MTKKKKIIISIFLILTVLGFMFVVLPCFFYRYWWIDYSEYKQINLSYSGVTFKIPNNWSIIENKDNSLIFTNENGEIVMSGGAYYNEITNNSKNNLNNEYKYMTVEEMIKTKINKESEAEKTGKTGGLNGFEYWDEYLITNSNIKKVYYLEFRLDDCDMTVELVTTSNIDSKTVDNIIKSLR